MGYREDSFRRKFATAAQHLDVKPEQIVSLKLRENVGSYHEYQQLMQTLDDIGFQSTEIQGELQGRGHLVCHGKMKLVIVEHETGLEVLYIAGAIASLIGLVPLVVQAWRALRGHPSGRHGIMNHDLEIRSMDASGHLREKQVHDRHLESFAPGSVLTVLTVAAGLVEADIRVLSDQVQRLNSRVAVLEKQGRPSPSAKMKKKRAIPKE